MDKSAKLTPLKMFFPSQHGHIPTSYLSLLEGTWFFCSSTRKSMPSEVGVLSSDTYMCDNQNGDCRTNDIKVEGHLLGNSYDSVWGSCRRFPPQKHECMYQGGGVRISESVNQEGMNLESCSCIFFFEGE